MDKVIVKDQDVGCIPSVNADVVSGDFISEKGVSDPIFGKSEGTFGDDDDSELEASQQSKDTSSVVPSAGMSQIHIALSGSPSSVL